MEKYFSELLNEQNEYQLDEDRKVEGPLKEITDGEVETAIKVMKQGKVTGTTGVTSDLLQAVGKTGVRELTDIMNKMLSGEKVPGDWE